MRRVIVGIIVVVCLALTGLGIWRLWPIRQAFYTDADAIRALTATVNPRDILWQPAKPWESILNSEADDYEPRLSADGLTLFFVRGKAGQNADIYESHRSFEGWSEPTPVSGANSQSDDLGPEPSADGQALYFYSNREGGLGGYDLWVTRRGDSGWQSATNLGPAVNSEFNDYGPALSPDGRLLYFASNRPQPSDTKTPNPDAWPATLREDLFHRTYDLYTAAMTDAGFAPAEAIAILNTPYNEGAPAVSPFGDFVYFASDRPGGLGGFDLYRTRRVRGEYRPPTNLGDAVNTQANELDPALSMGGYGLSFSSDRPTQDPPAENPDYNLYYTTSREVFTEVEQLARQPLDWAAFWRTVGPNLLWALLALLLLLCLLALFRGMQERRLSLMMKCLLASLAAHLLLMLLFNALEVAATIGEFARGRRGPIQVALAAPSAKSIAAQIRGPLTQFEIPSAPAPAAQRAETRLEMTVAADPVHLTVPRTAIESTARFEPASDVADATIDRTVRPIEIVRPNTTASPGPVITRLPEAPAPDQVAEETQPPNPAPRTEPARAEVPGLPSDTPAMIQTPSPATPLAFQSPVSLASTKEAVEATPRAITQPLPHSQASSTLAQSAATPAAPHLRLPADMPQAIAHSEANEAQLIRTAAAAPRASVSLPNAPPLPVGVTVAPPPSTPTQVSSLAGPSAAQPLDAPPALPSTSRPPSAGNSRVPPTTSAHLAISLPDDAPTAPTPSPAPTAFAAPQPPSVRPHAPQIERPVLRLANLSATPLGRIDLPEAARSLANIDRDPIPAAAPTVPQQNPLVLANHVDPTTAPTLDLGMPAEELPPDSPYAQRFAEDRMDIVERMGGNEQTERAVASALKWLADHQSADGRWDADGFDRKCRGCGGETDVQADNALTGLSLLCFLGAGHTHAKDGPYRDTVERGLQWLASRQKPDGDLRGGETMYSHGIATIALSEAFAITGDSHLRDVAQRAVAFIEKARNHGVGGWRYDPGQAGDTSVLGWQMMALKSASLAGLDVSASSFDAGKAWLARVSDRRRPGRYSYQPGRDSTPSMTAEAMFVQQLLGMPPTHPKMQGSAKYIMQHLPNWDEANTYYWYYAALALFQHQGEAWEQWNAALREQLLGHQRVDGRAAGSWDPDGEWADVGGRVYQTALCTLMLEVYYRYLPLFSTDHPQEGSTFEDLSDAIGTIRGVVTAADGGRPLPGATVRLDLPDREPVSVTTEADGTYMLGAPQVPEFFALSASLEGYVPKSVNVEREELLGRTLEVNFALEPASSAVLVTEAVPDVHHLGDNRFDGTINSQFQKRSEGSSFSVEFQLSEDQLPPRFNRAEVRLLAKGVQRNHRIVINGETLRKRLNEAPDDGSFGEFAAPFPPSILVGGANTLEIIAAPSDSDIDDFEFVNVQIHLAP